MEGPMYLVTERLYGLNGRVQIATEGYKRVHEVDGRAKMVIRKVHGMMRCLWS
jgi:hypothetical protein